MRYLLFVVFSILTQYKSALFAQKQGTSIGLTIHDIDSKKAKTNFTNYYIGIINSESIKEYIASKNTNTKTDWTLTSSINSKTGTHFTFRQTYNNIPIYRSEIKVNCNNKGYITSTFYNTFEYTAQPLSLFPAEDVVTNFLYTLTNIRILNNEQYYFPHNEQFIPVKRIEVLKNNNINYEFIIDVSGNILYSRDLGNYYQSPIDSTVTALVFNPDPLTTANTVYGSPYVDNNDNDVTQLNAQRVTKNMKVTYSGDTFYLVNNYVQIKNFDPPHIAPVYMVTTPSFSYTRAQDGFEDVNAFYHLNTFQNHLQNLGFTNLVNYSIEVDAHAMNGSDNSQFIASTQRLYFGEGGVDDAEDADVIIHEYGHAISHSAAQGTNNGTERQALDEGLGDYLASSYSRFLNSYKWENVFSWDGHNTFWTGRTSITTKNYPSGLVGNIYNDAEIWSSTLMQIWGDIGRNATDEILLESLYSYASNISMADAAVLYIKADSNLNGGANYTTICNRFLNRGLVSSCPVSINEFEKQNHIILNTQKFASSGNIELHFNKNIKGKINIYDIQGRNIHSENIPNSISELNIEGINFPGGMYIISIQTETDLLTTKAIRY